MNVTTMRGMTAELRWSYAVAARLGPWTLTMDQAGARLTATVQTCDAFRVQQQPLTFCVVRQTTAWKWPVASLHIADGTLTASLGPQEETTHVAQVHSAGDRPAATV